MEARRSQSYGKNVAVTLFMESLWKIGKNIEYENNNCFTQVSM